MRFCINGDVLANTIFTLSQYVYRNMATPAIAAMIARNGAAAATTPARALPTEERAPDTAARTP